MKAGNPASHPDNQPKEALAYADLLNMAHDEGLKSIATQLVIVPNDENGRLAIVKATVEVEKGRFEGLGDADPSSVEAFLAPHLIRVAETRAKARALRDAVNCGVVSFDELDGVRPDRGSNPGSGAPAPARRTSSRAGNGSAPRGTRTASSNGQDGPISEAQRRYLFRLLAGQGYQGIQAEEYLRERFGVQLLTRVTRSEASAMIDQLLQTSAPGNGGGGSGAAAGHQR